MLSSHADAILFCSLVSGRNPDYLIGEHVKAAPAIKAMKLETIPTGYILIESGRLTAVSYTSHTMPVPRDKPEIAKVHALAAQYLGMKMVYLEAGSGAEQPVPIDLVENVVKYVDLPVIIGGGITDSSYAHLLVKAGASFIVIGNALENDTHGYHAREFAHAIHGEKKR
jgi:phosphoglycerol geranylgeranyltransferase